MPYNLRKRPVRPEPPQPVKKRRVATTTPAVTLAKAGEDVPKAGKAVTKAEKAVPKAEKAVPKAEKAAPKAEKAVTKAEKAVTKAEKDVTKAEKAAIKADKDIPRSSTRAQLVFGDDSCGELGLGKIGITKTKPALVPISEPVLQVACGPMHTVTLTEEGKIYSYGCNDEGALGRVTDGDETLEATPTLVPIPGKIIKVTAGDSHTAVLTDKNEAFVWGNFRDEHGSVGLTPSCDGKPSYKPIQLLPDVKFRDIASGGNHMLLLDVDGDVYSFGVGAQGQLGRLKPEEVGEDKSAYPITTKNRELFLTPQKVSLEDVDPQRPFVCDAIYAGNFSSFATNTDKKKNRLAGWGLNNYFQLGYKGKKDQIVQHFPRRSTFTCSTSMAKVACGQHHTLFLTKTGRVYSAGRNEYGMLGLDGVATLEVCPAKLVESLGNCATDISAGINTSFAVTTENQLYAWGMGGANIGVKDGTNDQKVPQLLESVTKKVVAVSAGGSFTSILVED